MRYPSCYSYGIIESFAILFCKKVALVFSDIVYVINILYLRHLAICEHFMSVCGK
jgi:hypothetical protein